MALSSSALGLALAGGKFRALVGEDVLLVRWAARLDGVVRVDLRLAEEAPASVASMLLVVSVMEGMLSGEGNMSMGGGTSLLEVL